MDDLHKRRGKITITKELLFDGNLKFLKCFFEKFYPINSRWDDTYGFGRDLVYIGLSEHFDVVEEGSMAPEYTAEVTYDSENDTYNIKFIK